MLSSPTVFFRCRDGQGRAEQSRKKSNRNSGDALLLLPPLPLHAVDVRKENSADGGRLSIPLREHPVEINWVPLDTNAAFSPFVHAAVGRGGVGGMCSAGI